MKQKTSFPMHEPASEDTSDRREFLGKASCAVFAALMASGISGRDAMTFPVATASAVGMQSTEILYPLPASDGVSVDRDNDVILIRSGNRVFAFALSCPHENTALRWQPQDNRFQCPLHKSRYQPDGTFVSGRATRNMDRFALRLQNGKIAVDISKRFRSDRQKAEWDAAVLVQ
jgi:nitrite reductase/ring-hydroxylating ferredoxin subunit